MEAVMGEQLGMIEGHNTVRPFMNEKNNAANITAFAQEFRSWFDNDKNKALAQYQFGKIGSTSSIPFSSETGKNNYLQDALAVGDHVKKLLRETLVNNYFQPSPAPMRFSIGFTDRVGGDLETGTITTAGGDTFISVRILCEKPTPP
jgi:hypothetical protein